MMDMPLSASTSGLLSALDDFSRHRLTRQEDLGILLELAFRRQLAGALGELAFSAKFVSRTHGIMKRIGKDGAGYVALEKQFGEQLEAATGLVRMLTADAPEGTRDRFAREYFSLTPDALGNLLALFYDLSWYKNWLIDHETGH